HDCRDRGLCFLAAEPASHALAKTDDLMLRKMQRFGDDVLDFGRILRRRMNGNMTFFARIRDGRLRFEIKLLLPADVENAATFARRGGDGRGRFATRDASRWADEPFQFDG